MQMFKSSDHSRMIPAYNEEACRNSSSSLHIALIPSFLDEPKPISDQMKETVVYKVPFLNRPTPSDVLLEPMINHKEENNEIKLTESDAIEIEMRPIEADLAAPNQPYEASRLTTQCANEITEVDAMETPQSKMPLILVRRQESLRSPELSRRELSRFLIRQQSSILSNKSSSVEAPDPLVYAENLV